MYDIEKYCEARSVEEAVGYLKSDEKAQVICGGTDVLVKLRDGKGAGCTLVSIGEIPELKGVDVMTDGTIVIGPTTPFSQITDDPVIQRCLPYLGEAVDTVGGPQIRNAGTIGGNLCNGATSADSAATMQTLNATLVLQGPEGSREVPVTEFYTGPGRTVRKRDEVLIAILVKPEDYIGYSGCYIKYGKRNAMEIATLGCCVRVKLEAAEEAEDSAAAGAENCGCGAMDNTTAAGAENSAVGAENSSSAAVEDPKAAAAGPAGKAGTAADLSGYILGDVRIGYGVAAPTPIRCPKTEELLKGRRADDPEIYGIIGTKVLEEVQPRTSWRASKEFRLQLISEMAKRALRQAILRGIGQGTPGADYFPPVESELSLEDIAREAKEAEGKGGEDHA